MAGRRDDFHQLLMSRRSIRRFSERDLPRTRVDELLALAATAPSAHDSQPWRFVVVERGRDRERLVAAMAARFRATLEGDGLAPAEVERLLARSRRILGAAPWVVVLCLDPNVLRAYRDERRAEIEHTLGVQSVAIAGAFLLLAAHAEGLGACWMSAPLFAAAEARSSLDLPALWEPQGLVLLGYPAAD